MTRNKLWNKFKIILIINYLIGPLILEGSVICIVTLRPSTASAGRTGLARGGGASY